MCNALGENMRVVCAQLGIVQEYFLMTIYFPQPLTAVHHNKNGPPLPRYNALLLRIFRSDCRWIRNVIKHIILSWQVDECQEKPADLMIHSPLLWWCVHDFKRFPDHLSNMRCCLWAPKAYMSAVSVRSIRRKLMEIWSLFTEMKMYRPKNKHWSQSHCSILYLHHVETNKCKYNPEQPSAFPEGVLPSWWGHYWKQLEQITDKQCQCKL